jgi:hypothetical protein
MGLIASAHDISFVITTGDNFYVNGVSDIDDPKWFYDFGTSW